MTNDERKLFSDALAQWGPDAQIGMLHEEMGELMVVLNKLRREPRGASWSALRGNALEEVEDVRVMLDQVVVLLNSNNEHQGEIRAGKLARLRELIEMDRAYRKRMEG